MDTENHPDLLMGAEELLLRNPNSVAHRRGAAFLARQAVEAAVRDALGPADAPMMRWASRFLVLGVQRPDAAVERGRLLWERWSEICHYHQYDLVPAAAVIRYRIDETRQWIDGLSRVASEVSPGR